MHISTIPCSYLGMLVRCFRSDLILCRTDFVSIAGSQIYFETAGRSIEVSRSWLLQVARDILRGADEDEEVVKTSSRSDFSRDGIIVVI